MRFQAETGGEAKPARGEEVKGSPNAHQPVAMWLMLALGLLATLYMAIFFGREHVAAGR